MAITELKNLIKIVRQAIIDANNTGNFKRVSDLKLKKVQLRRKLDAFKTRMP